MKLKVYLGLLLSILFVSCEQVDVFQRQVVTINNLERKAFTLSKANRELKIEVSRLKTEIRDLESKNFYLEGQLKEKQGDNSRMIASLGLDSNKDMVKNEIYQWKDEDLMRVAKDAFAKKDYEKAAQFFSTLAVKAENPEKMGDDFWFQAGMAAYESGRHYDWAIQHFSTLVENFPTSEYFLGSKLWIGLSHYKKGERAKFLNVVEEFRKKYRNTKEWKVMSQYYDEITHNSKL